MVAQQLKKVSGCCVTSSDIQEKLTKSRTEAAELTLRDIHCPYCGFIITRVYSDVQGHYLAKCRKCKNESILNFAYFRKQNGIGKLRLKYYLK